MKLSKQFTTVTPFSKFLALALFVFLPIAAFFYGLSFQKPIPLNTTRSQVTVEDTSNWKMYQGDGFTFKYPDYLNIVKNTATETMWRVKPNHNVDAGPLYIKSNKTPIDAPKAGRQISDGDSFMLITDVFEAKPIILGGQENILYRFTCGADCGHEAVNFKVGNIYYQIVGYSNPGFDSFLSSFKLTN